MSGEGNPLQYSCLENPIDRGAWWATAQEGLKESEMTERISTEMWKLDHRESGALKNWHSQIVVLGKTLENPLNYKIKRVNPKGNQPWIFIGRTDAEVEAPIIWPPDVKSWLTGKEPDAGKSWGQEEKVMTEDEMVGWHHWLNGHEFEKT